MPNCSSNYSSLRLKCRSNGRLETANEVGPETENLQPGNWIVFYGEIFVCVWQLIKLSF